MTATHTTPTIDQYHRAAPGLALAATTEHPPTDPRDRFGPCLAQLDALRDLWRACGLDVDTPAVGVLRARDAFGGTVKLALTRTKEVHRPATNDEARRIAACAENPGAVAELRGRLRRQR